MKMYICIYTTLSLLIVSCSRNHQVNKFYYMMILQIKVFLFSENM